MLCIFMKRVRYVCVKQQAYETLPLVGGRKSYEKTEIEIYETCEIEFLFQIKNKAYLMDAFLEYTRMSACA